MRIRKHAKISPLFYAASYLKPGTVLQTHVCQLNQSPWDVMKFSPPSTPPPPQPPPQVDGDGVSAGNGSSRDCISVLERDQQWEYSDDIPAAVNTVKAEDPPPPPVVKNETDIILCCKTDGKSWQCRREASEGNSLCDHHLSQVKSYNNNSSHHAAKKSEKLKAEARRRVRAKKSSTSSSSNPYEFYYYSGFGPRWGKKRGGTCKNTNNGSMNKNVDHKDEIEQPTDYDEYEDDEEEEVNREIVKKRVRKPIKARSLKSLM